MSTDSGKTITRPIRGSLTKEVYERIDEFVSRPLMERSRYKRIGGFIDLRDYLAVEFPGVKFGFSDRAQLFAVYSGYFSRF